MSTFLDWQKKQFMGAEQKLPLVLYIAPIFRYTKIKQKDRRKT
jgi:hypothetical protein